MIARLVALLAVLCVAAAADAAGDPEAMPAATPAGVRHPLDPLTEEEIRSAAKLLRESQDLERASFATIELHEPPKSDVIDWKPGQAIPRRAFAVIRDPGRTREAIVDLSAGRVESWHEIPGAQPALSGDDINQAARVTRESAAWREALSQRGLAPNQVRNIVFAAGNGGKKSEQGRRLARVLTYDRRGGANFWAYPIEGLVVTVDLDHREVHDLVDAGAVPSPPFPETVASGAAAPASAPAPAATAPPASPRTIAVEGTAVAWERWRFHLRVDARVGTVVSLAALADGADVRSVLYQGYLSEIFVPYMDPAPAWQFRTFFDAGEFGIGRQLHTLVPGRHCPAGALLQDAVLANPRGEPVRRAGLVCLFERERGDPAWSHSGSAARGLTPALARELVVRSIATLGNYDYVFDWSFQQDGSIRIGVGATGVALAKVIAPGEPATHGRLVAERTVAVNHDHFMSYRLDLDVDGRDNMLMIDELTQSRSPIGPRKSLWTLRSRAAAREKDAKLHVSMERPALWRVIAPGEAAPGYELHPSHGAMSLLAKNDLPQRRAAFTRHALWATPYKPDERYAAGDYPNQSAGGDGLPAWTAANRKLEKTDLVLWYTLGFHHVVRREDWPIMPTSWHFFELRPFDFFERNPLLD